MNVIAVVVTHNRKELLRQNLEALFRQTLPCDLLVVDNASTDGSPEMLRQQDYFGKQRFNYLRLESNLGGSGGFCSGVDFCLRSHWDYFWLMDDDTLPHPDALEKLINRVEQPNNVYGSVPSGNENGKRRLCFPAEVVRFGNRRFIENQEDLDELEEVGWLPFLGFLIHRNLVSRIGLPEKEFFILDDDVEYSERAKSYGAKIYMVKDSLLEHPLAPITAIRLAGRPIYYRRMPPWKIYYDVRNKIFIAKKYYGRRLWTQTLPGIILRLFFSLRFEKNQPAILRSYGRGLLDGFRNVSGPHV